MTTRLRDLLLTVVLLMLAVALWRHLHAGREQA